MIHTRHVALFFTVLIGVLATVAVGLFVNGGEGEAAATLPTPVFARAADSYSVVTEDERSVASVRQSLIEKLKNVDIPDELEEELIRDEEQADEEDASRLGDAPENHDVSGPMLLDYMPDGFGIYSSVEYGHEVRREDLDACGGHEHALTEQGTGEVVYHYHVLPGVANIVGCKAVELPSSENVSTSSTGGAVSEETVPSSSPQTATGSAEVAE